ncbi:MAG: hypothetical protein WCH77_10285, partial [Planctomycetota bacterium]
GGGTLPPAVVLTPGPGRVLTFASVSGSVSYNDVDAPQAYLGQYNGPDGGAVNFQDASWPNNYNRGSFAVQGTVPQITKRLSAGRWLRKRHWPGYP